MRAESCSAERHQIAREFAPAVQQSNHMYEVNHAISPTGGVIGWIAMSRCRAACAQFHREVFPAFMRRCR